MANQLPLIESPLSVKHEKQDSHLILEVRSDEFKICTPKVISKKEWFGLKEKKVVVHLKSNEEWVIKDL